MVFQIFWPRGIYRLVLLCQQLQYVIPSTLLMVPLFVTAHENTNVPHSDPKSKFIFSRLLEINWRNAPERPQIFSSIFPWVDPLTAMYVLALRFRDFRKCEIVKKDAIRVPTFYAPPIYGHVLGYRVRIMTVIVATLFGGIHCAGWNFTFPSQAELISWPVSSLIIVIVPSIFVPPIVEGFMETLNPTTKMIYGFLFSFGLVIYILSRVDCPLTPCMTKLHHIIQFLRGSVGRVSVSWSHLSFVD